MKRPICDGVVGKIRALALQVMSRITPTDSDLISLTCGNYVFYLCALTLILFFTGLGERDLWAPVEPRYAEIVRVMFAKSEWIVPTVNGELYTDKPILYFWLALIASKIAGGVNEWTVRLPAALGGIGFVMATYLVGRDFFSARVGIIAAAVLATSVRVIWEARWAHIDMLFGFLFLLTIYFGARSLLSKGGKREILWTYVFMALAVLAKGLIGIVLPALTLAAFAIARRDWRIIVDAKLQLGIPIFLVIAAPWFYLVNSATGGKWLSDFIYIHHLQRYTEWNGHRHAFFYYFETLPADFMPWTVFAIPAIVAYFPYRRLMQRPTPLFFSLCFLVVFLFFSISNSKRDLYLLPLMPTLALLVGNYIDDLTESRVPESALYRWLSQFYFGAVAILGLALPIVAWLVQRKTFWISLPLALILLIGGVVTVIFIRKHRPLKVFTAITLLVTFSIVSLSMLIVPYVNQFKSRRPFSLQVREIVPRTAPLYVYADGMHDFNFYTEQDIIPVLCSPREVADVLRQADDSYLLIKDRDLKTSSMSGSGKIAATDLVGSTIWHLIALEGKTAIEMSFESDSITSSRTAAGHRCAKGE
jgi:4-amino-4-deoxy-L-arabinose transferase-like glycosyltransferase